MYLKAFVRPARDISRQRSHARCLETLNNGMLADYYDVVIVGAGMVGSAMACAIGTSPLLNDRRVLLVEASPNKNARQIASQSYSNRVSAISPGSQALLQGFGAWHNISGERCKPFSLMHVWDSCGNGAITFDSKGQGHDRIATIVENPIILQSLYGVIASKGKMVDVVFGTTIDELDAPHLSGNIDELVSLTLDNGHRLRTSLLIGADGHNSRVRKLASMKHFERKYDQYGVVATVTLEQEEENNVAWQQFHPSGPIALLPLTSRQSSLVWSTSKSHAKSLKQVSSAAFVDALNHALQSVHEDSATSSLITRGLQQIMSTAQPGLYAGSQSKIPPRIALVDPKSRSLFPYGVGHAEEYVKRRIALVGDSAHRVHPLAGQGVNLGFGDVACLIAKLEAAAQIGEDVGYIKHLLDYESERQCHVVPMTVGIDLLKQMFSSDNSLMAMLRSLGLQTINTVSPVKNTIISFARQ